MKNITVRLEDGFIDELETLADEHDRSRNEQIRHMLRQYEELKDRIDELEQELEVEQNKREQTERGQLPKLKEELEEMNNSAADRYRQANVVKRLKWFVTGVPAEKNSS